MDEHVESRTVIFRTPHGSHLYGTAHAKSDRDYFTVVTKQIRPTHNTRARDARQTIVDGIDETVVDWSTFTNGCWKGVPQYLEAMFSQQAEVDKIRDYRLAYRAGSQVLETYRRTIKSFSYDDRDGGVKKRRHALRLGLNARDIILHGRFNPTLPEGVGQALWEIAEKSTPDEVYKIACDLVWKPSDFKQHLRT